jgi:hypothetical protein
MDLRAPALLCLTLLIAACTPILQPPPTVAPSVAPSVTLPATSAPSPTLPPTPTPPELPALLTDGIHAALNADGPIYLGDPFTLQELGQEARSLTAAEALNTLNEQLMLLEPPLVTEPLSPAQRDYLMGSFPSVEPSEQVVWIARGLALGSGSGLMLLRSHGDALVLDGFLVAPGGFGMEDLPPALTTTGVTTSGVNLRAGPSTVHNILARIEEGSRVNVLGKAPGGEWLRVFADGGRQGWMAAFTLTLDRPVSELMTYPTGGLVIFGRVSLPDGSPAAGVSLALYQGDGSGNSRRTDAVSGLDGRFYLYLPQDFGGGWTVEIVGLPCKPGGAPESCVAAFQLGDARLAVELPSSEIDFVVQPAP